MARDPITDFVRHIQQQRIDEGSRVIISGLYMLVGYVLARNGAGDGTEIKGRDLAPGVIEIFFTGKRKVLGVPLGDKECHYVIEYLDVIPTTNEGKVIC